MEWGKAVWTKVCLRKTELIILVELHIIKFINSIIFGGNLRDGNAVARDGGGRHAGRNIRTREGVRTEKGTYIFELFRV